MTLPISAYKSEILESVQQNQVTIIVAQTGAGKSTQVSQYLLERGYKVLVTEPRRLAARRLAERVSFEMNTQLGALVGYRTAYESADSKRTRCLYCTDGLALVRELLEESRAYDVLIIDELHEWNRNMELLVGWTKRELRLGQSFKLIVMSATIEAQALAEFYFGAKLIEVPGRLFPITDLSPGRSIEQDVVRLVEQGKSVLVFQPGKAEIMRTLAKLHAMGAGAELLPLHRDLTPEEQDLCFKEFGRPKVVVATNIAETSLTIPGINAVVDSGLERRVVVVDGIERLIVGDISRANAMQRRGRGGRTADGIYIDHSRAKKRLEFPIPEIQRTLLDQAVLRLEIVGIRLEELELFHQPSLDAIRDARKLLVELDCLEWREEGLVEVTDIGRQVAKLPLSAAIARMVVEGIDRSVVSDVIIVAAIIEVRSIVDRKRDEWMKFCREENQSDLLAQVAVYKALEGRELDDLPDLGIDTNSLAHARELVDNIRSRVGEYAPLKSTGKRANILRSVVAGLRQQIYVCVGDLVVVRRDDRRVIPTSSIFIPRRGDYVVGIPFDLQVVRGHGHSEIVRMITLGSRIDASWIDFDCNVHLTKRGKLKKNSLRGQSGKEQSRKERKSHRSRNYRGGRR